MGHNSRLCVGVAAVALVAVALAQEKTVPPQKSALEQRSLFYANSRRSEVGIGIPVPLGR